MIRSIHLIKVKGISLNLHWTFLILAAWVVAANFIDNLTWGHILWSLVFIFLVLLSVGLHELGHIWIARRYDILTKEVILLPTGGISYQENFPRNTREELLISLAGPLVNLVIAGLLLPFIQTQHPFWDIQPGFDIIHEKDFFYKLHMVNLALFAVNLLPAFPLDGGRILRALLGTRMNYFKATALVVILGKILAAFFFITGILYFNLLLLVLSLLIFGSLQVEEYKLHLRSLIRGIRFEEVVFHDYQSMQAENTVQEAMGMLTNNHTKYFFVMEKGLPVGLINRLKIINEAAEKNYLLPVKSLLKKDLLVFSADNMVEDAFKTLVAFPNRIYPVMRKDRFIGVVSLMNILEYLLLHQLAPGEHAKLKALMKKI